jgi:hypothetical protein
MLTFEGLKEELDRQLAKGVLAGPAPSRAPGRGD